MSVKVFIAFTIVSISSMFPNNAFMNAHEYFYYKLRNVTEIGNATVITDITPMQSKFEAYLMVFGGVACVLGSILNVFSTKAFSNTSRVMAGHVMVLIVLIPTIGLTFVDTDSDQEMFFYLSLSLISVACFGSLGLMAGGVLGLSALFPAKYTQAVMIGQSSAGVLAALLSIFCQAATSNVVMNGQFYFVFCIVWTIGSIFVYLYLVRLTPTQETVDYARLILDENEEIIPEPEPATVDVRQQTMHVFRQAGVDLFAISLILIVTITAYPALSSLVRSTSKNHLWNEYFSSVISFLLYNIGDLVGRSCSSTIPLPRKVLVSVSLLRFLLIPLIAACNVQPRVHTHAMLPYDGVFVLLIFLLAISHGFCITNATISATKSIEESSRELAGSVTALVGVTAALLGAIFGVLILLVI